MFWYLSLSRSNKTWCSSSLRVCSPRRACSRRWRKLRTGSCAALRVFAKSKLRPRIKNLLRVKDKLIFLTRINSILAIQLWSEEQHHHEHARRRSGDHRRQNRVTFQKFVKASYFRCNLKRRTWRFLFCCPWARWKCSRARSSQTLIPTSLKIFYGHFFHDRGALRSLSKRVTILSY